MPGSVTCPGREVLKRVKSPGLGGGFGGGYGHGGRPSDGEVRAGGLGAAGGGSGLAGRLRPGLWGRVGLGAAGSGPGKGVYGFFGREVCLNHTVCC